MKHQKQIVAGLVILAAVAGVVLVAGGIGQKPQQAKSRKTDRLKIVILDSGDYFYSDEGIENGIRLAQESLEKEKGINVDLERVDDGGDYVNGISMAKALAEDESVDMVISFQNFESIGAEAGFFEQVQKPFIITMGCYDEVAERGYEYLITDFLSGRTIGSRIGEFLKQEKRENIALCHSDTTFEKDELRGIQSAILDSENTNIYYTQTGPFDEDGLAQLLVRCEKLSIDTVVANFYTQTDSAWLLGKLRRKRPDLTVIGDYALDSSEILKKYGKDLEGVVIVPVYPCEDSEELEAFTARYEKEKQVRFSTAAVQYYDLFQILGKAYDRCGGDRRSIMRELKKKNGYDGVAGKIYFDEKGRLFSENCPVFVCRNSKFVQMK